MYSVHISLGDFAVVRYNTDGSLDSTFGTSGKVTTPFGTRDDEAYAITIQTDGKIVAAGRSSMGAGNFDFALARYNANGTLDTSFDLDGKVTTAISGSSNDEAFGIALQTDGKIVAVKDLPKTLRSAIQLELPAASATIVVVAP